MTSKPLVLVVGAAGVTGESIVKGLLKAGSFRVAGTVRPSSATKPATEALRSQGVEIRYADIEKDSVDRLKEVLAGVDILISAVTAEAIPAQRSLFKAAKEIGTIKRVVPCDFATPGARGVRDLNDNKLDIRDYIVNLGLPYTFIDVGWWMQITLPVKTASKSPLKQYFWEIHGDGDKKILVTNKDHIGDYVARIITDDRTLNQWVIVWEDEVSQKEIHELGERFSGEAEALKAVQRKITAEEVLKRAADAKAKHQENPAYEHHVAWAFNQYVYSMFILGENTLQNAKALGALDVRQLYPDVVPQKLEDFAKDFYAHDS
ncbi:NAD-P-binding protein [Obba rivulosa]|uniref:NAD-P-binding protein n=1 Tax=Obba rivulosa TaxID=1052685 RepID=A0A8E2DJF4_9APHY|nr:NAD-P-binding protein [Obba rivulosa]